jgi:hypothetical protein
MQACAVPQSEKVALRGSAYNQSARQKQSGGQKLAEVLEADEGQCARELSSFSD